MTFWRCPMKKLVGAFAGVILCGAAISLVVSCSPSAQGPDFQSSNNMTREAWLQDFDSFYNIIKDNYPFLSVKERMFGYNWLNLKDDFKKRLEKARNDFDCLEVFMDAVTALQNRHTRLMRPGGFDRTLQDILGSSVVEANQRWAPLFDEYDQNNSFLDYDAHVAYENGHYRIVGGADNWVERYGRDSCVVEVNGVLIDDSVRSKYMKYPFSYDYLRMKPYLGVVRPRVFGRDAEFKIRNTDGVDKLVRFRIIKTHDTFASTNPMYFGSHGEPVRIKTKLWPNIKAAYVWIRDFVDNQDRETLLSFYRKVEDYELLIIDVRGNDGGSYNPWLNNVIAPLTQKPLTAHMYLAYRRGALVNKFRLLSGIKDVIPKSYFKHLPPEVQTDDFTVYYYPQTVFPSHETHFRGKIAILTDEITFSATDAFALFCKETNFGKIFGTPTRGDGIAPNPLYYALPHSKLAIRFTQDLGIDYNGNANDEVKTQPDVFYESSRYYDSSPDNSAELIDYVIKSFASHAPIWNSPSETQYPSLASEQISAAVVIDQLLEKSKTQDAVSGFRSLHASDPTKYFIAKDDFFALGYKIMKNRGVQEAVALLEMMGLMDVDFLDGTGSRLEAEGRLEEAIEVLALNAEYYPDDANVYESLAEAYQLSGNKKLAIENYENSIKLNPENLYGINVLKELKSHH
jgi:tetratricopeptide (TPR) repeat protein